MSAEAFRIPDPPAPLKLEQLADLRQQHKRRRFWLRPTSTIGGVPTLDGSDGGAPTPERLVDAILTLAEEALRIHAIASADPACPVAEAADTAIAQLKRKTP